METIFLGIVIFLILLAIFDLFVGVSNDAVNFLNSAIGAKAGSFRTVIIIAALGILCGAAISNGMMDVARHGMFFPGKFSFDELMCVFFAVMVTDVILLDIFNSLGLPTSTTVSIVFELLGGAFILSAIKISNDATGLLSFPQLLNTSKALTVIFSIFLSVAIAFFFGIIVQWFSRLIFTFNYKNNRWFVGIFGGLSTTSLVYFILIEGLKASAVMPNEIISWVDSNTLKVIFYCFVASTLLMQFLHWLKIDVFRIIVLLGTFALAMAFAGNDLVNFIGVPLAGLDSYADFTANGNGDYNGFMMNSLQSSAHTPTILLLAAGVIMVISLVTSKKAQNVVKTSVDLSRQDEGDEMFGSSAMARTLVYSATSINSFFSFIIPRRMRKWIAKRFDNTAVALPQGAAFDMIRASINLVLSSTLITMGTNLKLPLSTTYVTFMVAMGSSLSDKAWGRESAVFRITGMLSVIGGWFITAAAAFILCAVTTLAVYYGGFTIMVILLCIVIYRLVASHIKFNKQSKTVEDKLFSDILRNKDKEQSYRLFMQHTNLRDLEWIDAVKKLYQTITDGFVNEDRRKLRKADASLHEVKSGLKKARKKDVICLRNTEPSRAMESTTWIFLGSTSAETMLYSLRHIEEPCKEHLENNFNPMPDEYIKEFLPIRDCIISYFEKSKSLIENNDFDNYELLLHNSRELRDQISDIRVRHLERVRNNKNSIRIDFLYLTLLQESRELLAALRRLLRANSKLKKSLQQTQIGQTLNELP